MAGFSLQRIDGKDVITDIEHDTRKIIKFPGGNNSNNSNRNNNSTNNTTSNANTNSEEEANRKALHKRKVEKAYEKKTNNNLKKFDRTDLKEKVKVREEDHFQGTYKLKPNSIYTVNGYTYETDELGRIKSAKGKLRLEKGKRNNNHQKKVGGTERKDSDHGGHLLATRFGGSGKIDNLVLMNANLNQSAYRKLENIWDKALKNNKEVTVKIIPKYKGNSLRPDEFTIVYQIDDEEIKLTDLKNCKGAR